MSLGIYLLWRFDQPVSGDTDYLLIIHVKDMNDYNDFATNEPNIKQFRSSFCLNRTKYNTQVVLSED